MKGSDNTQKLVWPAARLRLLSHTLSCTISSHGAYSRAVAVSFTAASSSAIDAPAAVIVARNRSAVGTEKRNIPPRNTPAAIRSGVHPCLFFWFQTLMSAPLAASKSTTVGTCL